ncbi:hypothetical protein ACHQM5_012638 [Ranunculus cassubicifolius]
MGSLIDLRLLNISHNRFSGYIPKELNKLSSLESLNMSFNDFEGEVPMQGIFLNVTAFSISENPRVCGGILNLHLTKCQSPSNGKGETRLSLKVALGVFLPLFVVVMVFVIFLMRKSKSNTSTGESGLDHKRVSFIDLHRATNGFSSENLIGTGRYGFVYKGIHRQGGIIAVKVLNLIERGALKTFLAECEALRVIRHRNLLKILTVCSSVDFHGNDFKALIYEFMHNGSLDSWLHQGTEIENEASYLTFHQKLNIAIDIASALDYLHNHCGDPVIHCDLKPGNVLLGDDLSANVGDFGLAKFLSLTSSSIATDTSSISIRGTIGYIPPEYGAGAKVSTKGDVYSFGILLLEMFTGKRPTDPIFKDGLTLHEYSQLGLPERVMEIIDINVLSEFHEETSATIEQLKDSLISIVRIGVAKTQTKAPSHQSDLDHKRVSFIDLHRATNGFASENLIGTGRYGFVYKGMHQQGELIAVKVLNLIERGALKNFLAECEALRVIRHRNLLKILTVCSSVDFHGNDFKALVFEFMHNGSLDSWLHRGTEIENEPRYLTFHQRLNIAIDIASALDYLHSHCGDPVIHCDLKPGNVLLGDDLTAHVGDFGLAKFLSLTSSSCATDTSSISIRGTIGYIPPEYGAGAKVSTQGDVYSYGILLLEMFTGKRPTDPIFKDGLTLHEYSQLALPERVMEIIDINVLSEFHKETSATIELLKESLIWIVRIGVECSMDLTTERMTIETAVKELSSIKRNFS